MKRKKKNQEKEGKVINIFQIFFYLYLKYLYLLFKKKVYI